MAPERGRKAKVERKTRRRGRNLAGGDMGTSVSKARFPLEGQTTSLWPFVWLEQRVSARRNWPQRRAQEPGLYSARLLPALGGFLHLEVQGETA